MKHFLISALFLGMVFFSYGQESKKAKEFPRFQKEELKINRSNAMETLKKNLEMESGDELRLVRSEKDQLDFTHEKYQQYYHNVKVEGAVYSVHSRNNLVESYSGEYKGIRNFDVKPQISAGQGLEYAIRHAGAKVYAWENSVKEGYPEYKYPKGELVIIGGTENDGIELTLAWKYDIYAAEPLYRAEVYINAKTGEYVKENQLIHHTNTPSSGVTLYDGNQNFTSDFTGSTYRLRQTVSGGGVQTYTLKKSIFYFLASDITSSSANSWADATAIQAHWGAEQTWAYYNTKHGRNSYNGTGAILKSYVHYSTNYVNAFWDGSRMTYGDGNLSQGYRPLVSLDICGHEISHGVTSNEANLTYSYESGALNESFSDIFGECIENYGNNGVNDWMMSCDIGVSGCGAFRNMINPNQYNDPDTYKGDFWYTGTDDNGGVHINSGVQNKWFYILTTGESGTNDKGYNYNVTGIGMEKAAKIAYRNLTVYLTASSNYEAARTGAVQSATDLYGSESAEVIATKEAWNAVGVYGPVPDTQAPTAPVLSTTSMTSVSISLSWTAATDNVGVTGYDIFLDGVKNNTSNVTALTYTINGLTAETTYNVYVLAKDAAGNSTPSNILTVTTPTVVETLVLGSYFETSIENWTLSSTTNSVRTQNASYAFEGSWSVMTRYNASATTPTILLSAYQQVEFKFYFTAVGMESGKTFTVRYSKNNGTSWSTVATFTSATSESGTSFITDHGFYVATVTMNSTSFGSTFKFRIQNNGSTTTDYIYFDAVTVKGRTNTSGSGNVVTLAPATKGVFSLKNLAFMNPDLTDSEILCFPNPVGNTLKITSREKIASVRIISATGSVISNLPYNTSEINLDCSKWMRGVYMIEVITKNGTYQNKIIKQ